MSFNVRVFLACYTCYSRAARLKWTWLSFDRSLGLLVLWLFLHVRLTFPSTCFLNDYVACDEATPIVVIFTNRTAGVVFVVSKIKNGNRSSTHL